jgi:CheY-like chemotaxis protein
MTKRAPTIPPQPPALADAGGLVLPPLKFAPLRVLCVDDNLDAADSLGTLLRLVGFQAVVCHDGQTALSVVGSFQPEACLLDITMPGMDGLELARRLRAGPGGKDMYLIAVTATGGLDGLERTRAAGFDLHLVKPVAPQQLIDVLFDFERRLRAPAAS